MSFRRVGSLIHLCGRDLNIAHLKLHRLTRCADVRFESNESGRSSTKTMSLKFDTH